MRIAPFVAAALMACIPGVLWAADITEGEVRAVARASDAFACDFYPQAKTEAANLVFSPLSLSTALNLTSLGAGGKTADEFDKVLHHPDVTTFHLIAGKLLAAFEKSKAFTVTSDNHLWVHQGTTLNPAFTEKATKFYGVSATPVDFASPETARKRINAAVAKKTGEKIPEILPESALSSKTRLVLTSTLYFQGNWESPFVKSATADMDFHLSAEKVAKVPMMRKTASLSLAQTRDYQAVEIPYAGKRLALLVLVPREGKSLADVEKRLTAEELGEIAVNLAPADVSLSLPRFNITTDLDLAKTLAKLGLASPFEASADFSNLTPEGVLLTGVYQKTRIAVDEEGTEATAATAVAAAGSDVIAPTLVTVDRPFVFMVVERNSRLVFFMGRVTDPTK